MREPELRFFLVASVLFCLASPFATATPKHPRGSANRSVDQTLSIAIEAAQPLVRQGFTVREEYWGGMLAAQTQKPVVCQLFKGNEYWFWAATDTKGAVISVHVYDEDGALAENEFWKKAPTAGAHILPRKTAAYYVIVEVESSPKPQARWALVFGFR